MELESPSSDPYVIIACDVTKDRSENEINIIIDRVRSASDILSAGYRLLVLGILHKVPHPSKYLHHNINDMLIDVNESTERCYCNHLPLGFCTMIS